MWIYHFKCLVIKLLKGIYTVYVFNLFLASQGLVWVRTFLNLSGVADQQVATNYLVCPPMA